MVETLILIAIIWGIFVIGYFAGYYLGSKKRRK